MKRPLWVLLTAAALLLGTGDAAAQHRGVALAFHLVDPGPPPGCRLDHLNGDVLCTQLPYRSLPGQPVPCFAYLIVCNGLESAGVSGFECGITYPGGFSAGGGSFPLNVFSWHLCADAEAPIGWPAPGGSNLITWQLENCQRQESEPDVPWSVIAVAGYFYVAAYSETQMWITPRSDTGHARVFGCDGSVATIEGQVPSRLGVAGFGGAIGYNDCIAGIIPTVPATWGRVKTQFR